MTGPRLRAALAVLLLAACLVLSSRPARAATYLPLPDRDLAQRSGVIVLAEVIDEEVGAVETGGEALPFTRTRMRILEVLKGAMSSEVFAVRVPGGRLGKMAWLVAGRPGFLPGQQVVLFVHRLTDTPDYALSEFALSKFDVLEDGKGARYAVRSTFSAEEERYLSGPEAAAHPAGAQRELEPFLQALREPVSAQALATVPYKVPTGRLRAPRKDLMPLWVNLGGAEPGSCGIVPCLVRWFWDTDNSPNATVRTTGAQTNLSDGSNGVSAVTNAVNKWSGIAGTQVLYSGPGASGNVEVKFDQETHPSGTWTTAVGCGGGVLGTGGPQFQIQTLNFKGEGYYPAQNGTVLMRKNVCGTGYNFNSFSSAVLHEVGHSVGLGHPDQAQSTHSTTVAADWNAAVMRSSQTGGVAPTTPQTDDIQAIQYYYGTGSSSACVPNATTLCLAGGRFQVQTTWRNAQGQTGSGNAILLTPDTGYFWFFSATNVEMVVKLLSTCAINQRFWVFAGGLTDVQVTMTVTDTTNGTVKPYNNPQGTAFLPIQDTNAFATCP